MSAVAAPNASTELLQQLIRLECVNTGQPDSGDETRHGCGLFSTELTYDEFVATVHAANERCDVHSLALMEQLWSDIAVDLLG